MTKFISLIIMRSRLNILILTLFSLLLGISSSSYGDTWTQVNQTGFGDINNNQGGNFMVFNDYFYASTWNEITGVELWRSLDGTTWTQVNVDGFGDSKNTSIFRI